ncbi:hypothetical protein [uncultured Shewanella sp.]|uniref:hypothetical protein n=1 Tax=uncultured Shewanella sp. TaxID=173975 RepID=UPI0026065138|nr:hypothetical protein [uncultured Shewanella sp.]
MPKIQGQSSQMNVRSSLAPLQQIPAYKFDINQVPLECEATIESLDLAGTNKAFFQRPKNKTIESLDLAVKSGKTFKSTTHIERAQQLEQKAKDNGIELAKKAFFKAIFNVALAGLGLGLAIAATAFTNGAGIPVLAATGVAFALVVSDAGCAYADWSSKARGNDGLKMGSDTIANAVHSMLDNMGVNSKNSTHWANTTSVISRTALTLGTLWCSVTSTAKVPGTIGSTLSMLKLGKSITNRIGGMGLDVGISTLKKQTNKIKDDTHKNNLFQLHLNVAETQRSLDLLLQKGQISLEAANILRGTMNVVPQASS